MQNNNEKKTYTAPTITALNIKDNTLGASGEQFDAVFVLQPAPS